MKINILHTLLKPTIKAGPVSLFTFTVKPSAWQVDYKGFLTPPRETGQVAQVCDVI